VERLGAAAPTRVSRNENRQTAVVTYRDTGDGTPGAVYELCREAIAKGRRAPGGYALMQGCEVPANTPPYNLYVMRKAVEDFGSY
jgi:hypothetical protein